MSSVYKTVPPEELSKRIREAIKRGERVPEMGSDGPMWYRGHLRTTEEVACTEIEDVLTAQQAKRIIVGHTVQRTGKITSRCDGIIIGIDIGISNHYGANIGYLEIIEGDARAIYPSGIVDLPDPP